MDVRRKLIPLVPRSMALVNPPVWRVRWKFRSSRSKCSKTFPATFRIAFCATLANTAFRNSWKSVAPILVAPSAIEAVSSDMILARAIELVVRLTGYNHRPGHGICSSTNSCKINVHRIDDALEIERHFHIKNLYPDVCVLVGELHIANESELFIYIPFRQPVVTKQSQHEAWFPSHPV